MSLLRFASAAVLGIALTSTAACAPALRPSPKGWQLEGAKYTIQPLAGGELLPAGWSLKNYEKSSKGGYVKELAQDNRDLVVVHTSDDGVLVLVSEPMGELASKTADALLDRFYETVVRTPQDDRKTDEFPRQPADYDDAVAPIENRTHGSPFGRVVVVDMSAPAFKSTRRSTFENGGATASEMWVDRVPPSGGDPDRKLYLAVVRPRSGTHAVVLVYGNSSSSFATGLDDVQAFARRVTF